MGCKITVEDTGSKYLARWRETTSNVTPAVVEAQRETAAMALEEARKLSSGTVKTGPGFHPYSRRSPFGPGISQPYLINAQTNRFKNAWRVQVRTNADNVLVSLSNTSPEAQYLKKQGTRLMVGRGILDEVARRVKPKQKATLQEAILNVFSGKAVEPSFTSGGTNALGVAFSMAAPLMG